MNTSLLKGLAIALLVVAIALAGAAIRWQLEAGAILGPGALVATSRGEVWLQLDHALLRLDGEGRLLHEDDVATLGLPRPSAHLARHPDGRVVAVLANDATLYYLDAGSARVEHTVRPRWPADLARHGARAVHVAFADDGRIAISTGGGHAVATFDPQGAFLARTRDAAYRFTNGLWWDGDTLWTTDTNRFRLKQLDGRTLAVMRTIDLPRSNAAPFLDAAEPFRGERSGAPLAALTRLRDGMIVGRVVLVDADGTERGLPHEDTLEPVDIEWLGESLVASDGASFELRRWTIAGAVQPPFGEPALQQRLRDRAGLRATLKREQRLLVGLAIAIFAAAFGLAVVEERSRRADAPALDLRGLGTPILGARELMRRQLRALGPLLIVVPALIVGGAALRAFVFPGPSHALERLAIGTFFLALLGVVVWLERDRLRRVAQSAELEPAMNALAVRRLVRSSRTSLGLLEGESVRETFMWQGDGLRWVVVTDQRVLLFKATLLDHRLEAGYRTSDVT
ncbi:MAG TPA: hypothetical protein VFO79_08580, partial [Xanthomonadales bacterium]|nr:hypothetical protein [Xanthomonadales bacterium]